ncbi:MAG TPA: GNAT family N-acetyltransferase [Solirubrobacterales bacterium]|nr:GNAT family N-acetyltransferase [Solirubrobacterales bacterium]
MEADLPALAGMLTRAFDDDPVARYGCPRDALRPWMLERFHAARNRQMLRAGEIWMSAGGESAAVWAAPDNWRSSVRDDLAFSRALLHPRLLRRAPLVGWGLQGIERHHPPAPPHWYLATLGTEPAAQGRGLGSAVLAPVLEECDRDGVGAYLESSKERNIDYYARFGFRVTRELRLPRGPRVWLMWRDAKGTQPVRRDGKGR